MEIFLCPHKMFPVHPIKNPYYIPQHTIKNKTEAFPNLPQFSLFHLIEKLILHITDNRLGIEQEGREKLRVTTTEFRISIIAFHGLTRHSRTEQTKLITGIIPAIQAKRGHWHE